ncbi:hypothetical protein ACQEVF_32530 [Nonomuraea polychroma]|uniref:hypothetical protein n=1 Tax=Nonomuraea polychroma TaxID=46176 RepID=UPI003D8C0D18
MHHQQEAERWIKSLQQHAAHAAFPDWEPGPDDWTSLHTSFDHGAPVTEVAVYRVKERIHYRPYTGTELMEFWEHLLHQIAE